MKNGWWHSLETLPLAAVRADWQRELGPEFALASPFLQSDGKASQDYPCTHQPRCGCVHRVSPPGKRTGFAATCDCGCPPIPLVPADVVVVALDVAKLGSAICSALGFTFEQVAAVPGTAWSHTVGVSGAARSPVFLTFAASEEALLREMEGLIAVTSGPLILLGPTTAHCTARVAGMLRRNCCAFIPLSFALALGRGGKLVVVNPIDGILAEFERARVARGGDSAKILSGIYERIDAVANQNQELRTAKARLEAMQAEGLFAFASKIDHATLELFFAILASGNVAKAARDLGMTDSTLRTRIAAWKRRGKAYAALAEFVRWRKSIKGQAGKEFAKRLASGGERDVDYGALIRDVIEALEEFNSDNWEEKCEELEELLRSVT